MYIIKSAIIITFPVGTRFPGQGKTLDEGVAVLGHLLDQVEMDGAHRVVAFAAARLLWPPGQCICVQHARTYRGRTLFFCWYAVEEDSFLVTGARLLDQSIDCLIDAET